MLNVHTPIDCLDASNDIRCAPEQRIIAINVALDALAQVNQTASTTRTGDPEFDVELIETVNITRGALLRLRSLLDETISLRAGSRLGDCD